MLSKYGIFDEQKYKARGNVSDRALWGWISHDYNLNSISVGEKIDREGNIGMNTVGGTGSRIFWKAVMRSREYTEKKTIL